MLQRFVKIAVVLLLSTTLATAASATSFLEIVFDKYEASGIVLYNIFMNANKEFATTCELETPTGSYSFTPICDLFCDFRPDQSFTNDHTGMSFAELTAAISGDWTLTWDAGPTQTVATISFGTVLETDFPFVPELTAPLDGVPIEIPRDPDPPTIEWTYGSTPACIAQPDLVLAFLINDYSGSTMSSGYLPCSALSWTPSSPLGGGTWLFVILNFFEDYRLVPDGIEIVEGSWFLENDDWLSLRSWDMSENEVVPTKSWSWGAIKALYRE